MVTWKVKRPAFIITVAMLFDYVIGSKSILFATVPFTLAE